jgi:hypothetical protein
LRPNRYRKERFSQKMSNLRKAITSVGLVATLSGCSDTSPEELALAREALAVARKGIAQVQQVQNQVPEWLCLQVH